MPLVFEAIALVHGRDHLAGDRGLRAGPGEGATCKGTEVFATVDSRSEERVRRHVVDHHEVVLLVWREERMFAVALVGLRTGSLRTQDPGNASEQRQRSHCASVAQEAPPGKLSLRAADFLGYVLCHAALQFLAEIIRALARTGLASKLPIELGNLTATNFLGKYCDHAGAGHSVRH